MGFLCLASLGALVKLNLALDTYLIPSAIFGAISLVLTFAADGGAGLSVTNGLISFLFGLTFFSLLKRTEGERSWKTSDAHRRSFSLSYLDIAAPIILTGLRL